MSKNFVIGQRVKFTPNDFDSNYTVECMVVEVKPDYAIAVEMNEPRPMRLLIDVDTEDMFE